VRLAYLLSAGLANRSELSWRATFSNGIHPERPLLLRVELSGADFVPCSRSPSWCSSR
jgi:hypothetical protein